MRTALECLAKASEMEKCAAQSALPALHYQYLEAAIHWRELARRALVQEQRAALAQPRRRYR